MSKRGKIVRNIPLVLVTVVAGLAVKSAIDYKAERDDLIDNSGNMIEVPEEVMIKVEEGKALVYWIDDENKKRFLTTENSLIKNL